MFIQSWNKAEEQRELKYFPADQYGIIYMRTTFCKEFHFLAVYSDFNFVLCLIISSISKYSHMPTSTPMLNNLLDLKKPHLLLILFNSPS